MELMAHTGKAAVIHPTGTGKSIIAFKLIEDHPQKRICWLSPSNYIVQTQRENVRRLEPNFYDENVCYYTYARLMYMDLAELQSLQPDFIILDEFHRCGATEWGKGVQSLLACYPDVPVLGLSATSIRYLDGQRDMAEELFDGNIASEMSVAEAIATGILPTPTYVIALFSYQEELEKYERRVNSIRHRNNYDANRQYLEALRRALEMSVGLEEVFRKHITDKAGKYIVFCSSKEHMDSVLDQIPEWFSAIDKNPNVYCVYSDDLGSEQAFGDFKRDVSGHLKLLLCIDMLSEGIHVDDISGVILLRPTTSPIVYKQQIGRALAAGKGGTPLIFDVVNNFDSLYSASWLQEEVKTISAVYQDRGEGDRIVEESFLILDEVRECRMLLAQLEESLGASWEINYQAAKLYYSEYGDLNVPLGYRMENGIQLGVWISSQRRLYHGNFHGSLTSERIQKLEQIGMIWENRYETRWENMYQIAEEFYIEHGHLRVPAKYVTEDGIQLGRWISRQSEHQEKLSEEKVARLDAIGMVWINGWDARYKLAEDFLRDNPDYVLSQTTTIGDFWVGKWLVQQVRALEKGILQPEQANKIQILVDVYGVTSQTQARQKWLSQFENAKALTDEYGDCVHWPETPGTRKTLRWIQTQRKKLEKGLLRQDEILKLRMIGVVPQEKDDPWMRVFRLAENYYRDNGNLEVPAHYVAKDGTRLGVWISKQRSLYRNTAAGKRLSDSQIQMLESIGMVWDAHRKAFDTGMRAAFRYYEANGNLEVPTRYVDDNGFPLYQWLCDVRKKKSKLREEDIRNLNLMQFSWERSQRNYS
jgi:superfamily II DNA or RNA helicase